MKTLALIAAAATLCLMTACGTVEDQANLSGDPATAAAVVGGAEPTAQINARAVSLRELCIRSCIGSYDSCIADRYGEDACLAAYVACHEMCKRNFR
jgi:hypothetical protein